MLLQEAIQPRSSEQLRRKALDGVAKLPPFSAVMNKLMATVAKEDVSFGEVASIIEQDSVLVGNVLKLVNSAAFGRRNTVNSVRHAVSLLGLSKVRNAAMSISVGQMWGRLDLHPQWSPKQFHLHVTSVAVLADQLALELPVNYPEGAFTAGLLSGIGLLLLATALRQEFTHLNRAHAADPLRSLTDCEMEVFGFPHCEISADVMERWQLPAPMVDAVRASDESSQLSGHDDKPTTLSNLIGLAIMTAAQAGNPIQSWVRPPLGEPIATLEKVGLGARAHYIVNAFQLQMLALMPFSA